MLHESPDSKPETIEQCKIVFHHVRVRVAGVRVVPLVRAEPAHREERAEEEQASAQKAVKRWRVGDVGVEEGLGGGATLVRIKWHIKDTFKSISRQAAALLVGTKRI